MKKIYGLVITVMLCILTTISILAASAENNSYTASDDIIAKIQNDISAKDVQSWTETTDANMDFNYVVPIYTTTNVTEQSNTLTDTLEFTSQYNIPAVTPDGNCIGVFKVVSSGGKWEIGAYTIGLDFITAIKQSGLSCYIEIPQLSGDFGFLTTSDSGELYTSIASQQSVLSNVSAESILAQIKEANNTITDVDTDGTGVAIFQNNYTLYFVVGLVILLVAIAALYVRKRGNHIRR